MKVNYFDLMAQRNEYVLFVVGFVLVGLIIGVGLLFLKDKVVEFVNKNRTRSGR